VVTRLDLSEDFASAAVEALERGEAVDGALHGALTAPHLMESACSMRVREYGRGRTLF